MKKHTHEFPNGDIDQILKLPEFRTEPGDGKAVSWKRQDDGTVLVEVTQLEEARDRRALNTEGEGNDKQPASD